MDNELLLSSSNDIPFVEAQINIHQPTINEISLIGEESFWSGCQFLNFTKNLLDEQDKNVLEGLSDFEIFMSIMCSSEQAEFKNNAKMLLALIFPLSSFKWTKNELLLTSESGISRINKENFEIFKDIIVNMFGLEEISSGMDYNPVDKRAEKIAEKLKRRAKNKNPEGEKKKIAILSRYVSILAVGESKDKNELMNYTVAQLKDEFKRFQMKQAFDFNMQARLAGAQNLDEVDNWMDIIHS